MSKMVVLSLLTMILSSFALSQTKLYMRVSSRVAFIITDPIGRKTGADPRYSKTVEEWIRLEQIPAATYGSDNSNEGGPSIVVFETFLQSPQVDGTYTIELIGDSTKITFLNAYVMSMERNSPVQEPRFRLRRIPIERDSSITYRLTCKAAIGEPSQLSKVVSARSLVQDVAAMLKLNWITVQATAGKYLDWFRNYGSQFRSNDFGAAQSMLQTVLINLNSDSGTVLNTEAYKSLRSDTEQLLAQIPSIIAALDTLVGVKHRTAESSWLADTNFVNELDNGLENAKKHLAKGDSVNCFKEIQTFQDKVNKEYQRTLDSEKKGKPRDKRYVTVEGWKFLYYNAQYIMDRLPSKR